MPGDVNGLARFRADPEKVRVAVRRVGSMWLAYVQSRISSIMHYGRHRYAYRAIVLALQQAESAGLPGVDLSMSWSHTHPWATPKQRAHYEDAVSQKRHGAPER